MTFKDLNFKYRGLAGIQARHDFENGHGVSVVRSPYTYGGSEGLYELAVFHDGCLCYQTPITSDVLGWLSEDDVTNTLVSIAALPPSSHEDCKAREEAERYDDGDDDTNYDDLGEDDSQDH